MKKIFASTWILFQTALIAFGQQKMTEGKITYSISIPDDKKGEDNMLAMTIGKEQVIYFKGKQSRIVNKTQMGEIVVLNDLDKKSTYTLINLLGKKIALKADEADMDMLKEVAGAEATDKLSHPEVKITKETKKIAGYKCKKAVVSYAPVNGERVEGEVWYSDEIGFAGPKEFRLKEIEGLPMEFSYSARGSVIKMTCIKVEPQAITEDMFQVPDDYTVKTMMEMMSEGMGIR